VALSGPTIKLIAISIQRYSRLYARLRRKAEVLYGDNEYYSRRGRIFAGASRTIRPLCLIGNFEARKLRVKDTPWIQNSLKLLITHSEQNLPLHFVARTA
jgi:hypothetical protein